MREFSCSPALAWRHGFSLLLCTSRHIALSWADLSGQCLVGFPKPFVQYKQLPSGESPSLQKGNGSGAAQPSGQHTRIFAVAEKGPLKAGQ